MKENQIPLMFTAILILVGVTTGCGKTRSGLDLRTTPPAEVMILATALQQDELRAAVGENPEVFLVRSESIANASYFYSYTKYDRTFLVLGDPGSKVITFNLSSENSKNFRLADFEISEPTEDELNSTQKTRLDFQAVTFGPDEED